MENVILYFTDLEGTMLREKDGKYDPEKGIRHTLKILGIG